MDLPLPPAMESRGLFVAALLIVLIWGVEEGGPFLIPVSLAALVAFLMAPVVRALARLRVPEGLGIGITAVLFILPFFGLGYMIFNQAQSLVHDLPSISRSAQHWLAGIAATPMGMRLHLEKLTDLSGLGERLVSGAGASLAFVIAGIGAVLNTSSKILIILIFAIAMVASRRHLRRSAERILADHRSIPGPAVLDEVVSLVQRFLLARSLIVVIIGMADFAILALFGVKYGFLLGSFLGIMTLIPAVGFVIGLAPTLLVAVATGHSFLTLLVIVICLIIMSIIEGNVLTPALVGKSLNINALTTFLGFFAGGLLWGVWGMFLSIPILGVIRIVFSAIPGLAPWGELLAERSERGVHLPFPNGSHEMPPGERTGEPEEGAAAGSFLPFRHRSREARKTGSSGKKP